MYSLFQDVRLAGRRLLRAPSFTLPAWTALTLGIGGLSAVFSVVYAVILAPLPFPDAERLVTVHQDIPSISEYVPFGPLHFEALQAGARGIEGMAAVDLVHFNLRGEEGLAERLAGAQITSEFFSLLGVAPLLGRSFTSQEWQNSAAGPALVSHRLWQRQMGGAQSALGKAIDVEVTYSGPVRLSPSTLTVVGVLPQGFHSPWGEIDIWVPFNPDRTPRAFRYPYLNVLARLTPSVAIPSARSQLEQSYQAIEFQDRLPRQDRGLTLISLPERRVRLIRTSLLMLWAASGLVLLIACANVANLTLARAGQDVPQMALRAVLGASRARLMRVALAEGALLTLLGTASGLLAARAALRLLEAYNAGILPVNLDLRLQMPVLLFSAAASAATVLLFGLLPAWRSSRPDLQATLQEAGRALSLSPRRAKAGRLLVAVEMALALILLVCAGLVTRSLGQLQSTDPGFQAADALIFQLELPRQRYLATAQQEEILARLLRHYRSLPGVESAGAANMLPLTLVNAISSYRVDGGMTDQSGQLHRANLRRVSPGYLEAMAIPILQGRRLFESDLESAPRVAVVTQSLARRHWPEGGSLGQQIRLGGFPDAPLEIVGVLQDVRHWMLTQQGGAAVYVPQLPGRSLSFVLRGAGAAEQLAPLIRSETAIVDPQLPVFGLASLQSLLDRSTARNRFDFWLMGAFAAVALVLAIVGIYGVTSYIVAGRRHEIGLRMALGASRRSVLALILRQSTATALLGSAIGLAAALGLTRFLGSLLYQVSATDPLPFLAAGVALNLSALAAALLPARRAANTDPQAVLNGLP